MFQFMTLVSVAFLKLANAESDFKPCQPRKSVDHSSVYHLTLPLPETHTCFQSSIFLLSTEMFGDLLTFFCSVIQLAYNRMTNLKRFVTISNKFCYTFTLMKTPIFEKIEKIVKSDTNKTICDILTA